MKKAFTLIELLIVITLLGIMATIVIVLVNPAQRFAQTRDAGRITSVLQLGKAVQSFYTATNRYPEVTTWGTELVNTGYPSSFPSGQNYQISGTSGCATNVLPVTYPTYCYDVDAVGENGVVVFSKLESNQQREKCASGEAFFVYATSDGRGGVICATAEPTPWPNGSMTYID